MIGVHLLGAIAMPSRAGEMRLERASRGPCALGTREPSGWRHRALAILLASWTALHSVSAAAQFEQFYAAPAPPPTPAAHGFRLGNRRPIGLGVVGALVAAFGLAGMLAESPQISTCRSPGTEPGCWSGVGVSFGLGGAFVLAGAGMLVRTGRRAHALRAASEFTVALSYASNGFASPGTRPEGLILTWRR